MKYVVAIGTRTLEVVVDGDIVTVDGVVTRAALEHVAGTPEVRLVIDGHAATLAVEGERDGTWRLVDHGAVHEVGIEDERSRHIRLMAGAAKLPGANTVLRSPMPGLVVRLAVAVGDAVTTGAPLVVLEAMKMENELKAAGAGVVSAILVAAGQAVEKGQVLLELDSAPGQGGG